MNDKNYCISALWPFKKKAKIPKKIEYLIDVSFALEKEADNIGASSISFPEKTEELLRISRNLHSLAKELRKTFHVKVIGEDRAENTVRSALRRRLWQEWKDANEPGSLDEYISKNGISENDFSRLMRSAIEKYCEEKNINNEHYERTVAMLFRDDFGTAGLTAEAIAYKMLHSR